MGYVQTIVFRIGVGSVLAATKVDEAPGYTGERITPSGQRNQTPFTVSRRNRIVFKTKTAALKAKEGGTRA